MSQPIQALVEDIDACCGAGNWVEAIQLLYDGFDYFPNNRELLIRQQCLAEICYDKDSCQPNGIYHELILQNLARGRKPTIPPPVTVPEKKTTAKVIIETELAGRISIPQRRYNKIGKDKHGWHRCDRSGCDNIYTTYGDEQVFGFLTLPPKLEKIVAKSAKKHERSGKFNKLGMRKRNAHQPGSTKHFYCSPRCKEIADQIEKSKKSGL